MALRIFLDGRKLGDGGIGTFIATFVEGLIDARKTGLGEFVLDLVVGRNYFKDPTFNQSWDRLNYINIFEDNTKKYSFQEYCIFPLKWRDLIKKSDYYFSPHYTLPFFIPVKRVVAVHDIIQIQYPESLGHKVVPKLLIASALKRAHYVITVSNNSKKKIEDLYSLEKDKIKIIPNSVKGFINPLAEKRASNKLTFLYVGADRLHKRFDVFLEFIANVRDSGLPVRALAVTTLQEASRNLIQSLDIDEIVEVHENITDLELSLLYGESDALICTSIEEGFCLPLLEAMAFGLPVYCPELDYTRELVGGAGIYYEAGSSADLFYTFVRAKQGLVNQQEKTARGKEIAEKFTPLNQFKAFLACVSQ